MPIKESQKVDKNSSSDIESLGSRAFDFLSYKGWITANWQVIQDQTQSLAYNASGQVLNMVNNTASKFAAHPFGFV